MMQPEAQCDVLRASWATFVHTLAILQGWKMVLCETKVVISVVPSVPWLVAISISQEVMRIGMDPGEISKTLL